MRLLSTLLWVVACIVAIVVVYTVVMGDYI